MTDFLSLLFSLDFVTRDCCGSWHPAFRLVYVMASISVFLAYASIGYILLRPHGEDPANLERLTDLERARIRSVYGSFIATCGVGHLEGVLAFHIPAYHAFAAWNVVVAVVSWRAVLYSVRYRARILVGV